MRLRALRSFRWAEDHVEKGSLLIEPDPGKAAYLIRIGDCEAVSEADTPTAPSAMTVGNADPVVEHRDPIASRAPKGRRRS